MADIARYDDPAIKETVYQIVLALFVPGTDPVDFWTDPNGTLRLINGILTAAAEDDGIAEHDVLLGAVLLLANEIGKGHRDAVGYVKDLMAELRNPDHRDPHG